MNDLNAFTGLVRRCVEDYDMIAPGDTVAVGVSGGKDSLVLLMALNELRRYYPKPFTLEAITVELGFDGMDFAPVAELCDTLGVPYTRLKTDIKEVVFDVRKEDNPCSLCAKMRRGALCTALSERGITKLALGHHFDDAVETFLLSLVYEGASGGFSSRVQEQRMDFMFSMLFGLLRNDLRRNFPQSFVLCVRKNVLGHFNGGPVVGDHLDDEVVRNAAIQCGPGHSCDHPVQDAAIGLQIFPGT